LIEEPASVAKSINLGDVTNRFIVIPPGGELSRQVDPIHGFRQFGYGWSDKGQVSDYEVDVHLLGWSEIVRCSVEIALFHGFQEAFQNYTGQTVDSLGRFYGPTKTEITNPLR
jgi:hypothetical protein